ncbi:hypothetical protein [Ectobacillus funiculus]|uniref:hypothetical protein n=1 Tax=Ectobacillus funiculus TaxID=137993 RepID=UPI00101D5810|nr:hypothetical protein [Ectobacillus funiculus]
MIHYQCAKGLSLSEKKNGKDIEFTIVIEDIARYDSAIKKVRQHFDGNRVYTDVLFYIHKDNEYQIIVRHDYYIDFILYLFKYQLIQSLSWT